MKFQLAAAALMTALTAPALAQSDLSLMPEGSKEVTVSATLGNAPSRYGSALRSTYLVPHFSVEWSNGMFVEGLTLGMQMSRHPLMRYGPLLAPDLGSQHADGSKGRIRPVVGAFFNYTPVRELSLHAHTFAQANGSGNMLLNLKASTYAALAPRHQLFAGVGTNLFNGAAMQADFGTARYHPSGGVRDVYADMRWQWQCSRKYTLTGAVQTSRLLGDAAASPRTSERTGVVSSVTLSYSF
jgi:MipA family protein